MKKGREKAKAEAGRHVKREAEAEPPEDAAKRTTGEKTVDCSPGNETRETQTTWQTHCGATEEMPRQIRGEMLSRRRIVLALDSSAPGFPPLVE